MPVCLDVETGIAGKSGEEAAAWALADASRHSHTLSVLLGIARQARSLQILNASGLYHGHQDFSLATAMQQRGIEFEWSSHESADSPYLAHPNMARYLEDLGINVTVVDYRRPLSMPGQAFDVILFTEIVEHLDHTALLNALGTIHNALKPGGRLIVTTPNVVSLPNRLRVIAGRGDHPYFGDGRANLEAGLYGHIAAYDIRRLERLLLDAGLTTDGSYTFNWGRAWKRGLTPQLAALASSLIPGAGQNLLMVATQGDRVEIPYGT